MEFCNDGDLFQKIQKHQQKSQYLQEKEIWDIFIQAVKGLNELHKLNILHRDLKSANIFLTTKGEVKIGDLNVSKLAKKGLLYTQTGTPYYASPEVWKDKPYDKMSDIWSLGCILYEMTTLKPPFRAENMEGLYKQVVKGTYDKISSHFSKDLREVIKVMLQVNPQNRISCNKILSFPFLMQKLSP